MGKEYDWGAVLVSAHIGVQVAGDLTVAGVSLVSLLGRPLPLPGFCFESDSPGRGLELHAWAREVCTWILEFV